jgi:KAP family P-loop domain
MCQDVILNILMHFPKLKLEVAPRGVPAYPDGDLIICGRITKPIVADIAAEMIVQASGRPLSMGISGSWGVGKSSMMRLLGQSLRERTDAKFLFVEFNAWLYQGYDDTRAGLMEVIARALLEYAENEKTPIAAAVEKAKGLLARVNWFRVASVTATSERTPGTVSVPSSGVTEVVWPAL